MAESGEFGEFGESGESSIQKRPFIPNIEASTPHLRKKFNKGGSKFDEVWEYFIQEEEVNPGHYKVSCHYCKKEWVKGKPALLKAHLANECTPCPEEISKYWRENLIEAKVNYTRQPSVQNDNIPIQPSPKQ